MKIIWRIACKEFASFFSSPVAYIFFGAFLFVTLFVFFWVETFFISNIAEVRPLFEWMPILIIFLTAAITMRIWAEERRSGTLELLLTSPVNPLWLVLGKFIGCLGLVAVSLVLTLPIPVTVSLMGPLDWGPVWSGYLAAMFLAAAYIAIGLFVSVKSENQIISLIVTTLICACFYMIGSEVLTSFFGNRGGELLQSLGMGARFKSITRGVIDLRDLIYYLALVGVFLSLNVYGLEKLRWAGNPVNNHHRRWQVTSALMIANFLVINFWLWPVEGLRKDMTNSKIYSISEATRSYLDQLKEPLLIRGYFSAQTHPLLAPLVPQIRDLLEEFSVVGGSKVRVEFVDPQENPQFEQEAGQRYGIRPVPFRTASKYQASVTNSYFDILIQYGDQFETLGFRDLIEIKAASEQDIRVELRNPEYDITRAIKKALYSYQGGGDLFSSMTKPVVLTGYLSPDLKLPKELITLKQELVEILSEMEQGSSGLFSSSIVDPDAEGGKIADTISNEYGFQPMTASLFDQRTFWFYLTLDNGDQVVEIPLSQELDKESLKRSLDAGLKRFAAGFTKTIALLTPISSPPMPQFGIPARGKSFNVLKDMLSQEHIVKDVELENGQVPEDADLLLLVSPESLDNKQLFAVDQFLMQGGTVILASSPYDIELNQKLAIKKHDSGLTDWLNFYGVGLEEKMVLDLQNSAFPMPTQRQVSGFTVQEARMINYPYFVDVRSDAMDQKSGLMAGLNQITMNWSSPVVIDEKKNDQRTVTRLLESTDQSWVSDLTEIQPDFATYGETGFHVGENMDSRLLAVAVEGRFTSYFKDKPSPLLAKEKVEPEDREAAAKAVPETESGKPVGEEQQVISRMIDKSSESARIILFASNSFLADPILGIGSSVQRSSYLEPVQMIANAVDWSLEDRGLLEIRGRGHFSRPLHPMSKNIQVFWEYLNYGLALAGLIVVWFVKSLLVNRSKQRHQFLLQQCLGGK